MASHILGASVYFEDDAFHKEQYHRPKNVSPPSEPAPEALELESMSIGSGGQYTGPKKPEPIVPRHEHAQATSENWQASGSMTPNELEMSRPPSPEANDASAIVQSWNDPPVNRWRVLSACLVNLCNGFNDSAPGALLPYMQSYYHIDYAPSAIIWLTNAVGFITAAFFVHALDTKLGRSKTLMFCEALCVVGYVMMVTTPPYPVFTLA